MKRISKQFIPVLIATAFALLAVSCAIGKDESQASACAGEDPSITAERHSAFSATVSPIFAANSCTACHDGLSGAGPGSFANASADTAYGSARGYVNFDSAAGSRFVTKMKENHQCGSKCASIASEMETQIAAWATREAALPAYECNEGGSAITSAALTIKATDLNLTTAKVYRWDLSQATPPMPGAAFELKARLYYEPTTISNGSYILSDPKFAFTGSSNMRVSNISFVVNGVATNQYSNYIPVDFVVAPGAFTMPQLAWNFPILSTSLQVKAFEGPGSETLAVSLTLESTSDPVDSTNTRSVSCMNPTRFSAQVAPILTGTSRCVRCHAMAGNQAMLAFSMATGTDLCNEAMLRSTLEDPRQSYLITHPRKEDGGGHPALDNNNGGANGGLTNAQVTTIVDWLTEEAQLNGM